VVEESATEDRVTPADLMTVEAIFLSPEMLADFSNFVMGVGAVADSLSGNIAKVVDCRLAISCSSSSAIFISAASVRASSIPSTLSIDK